MSVIVKIPAVLRPYTQNQSEVAVEAGTLREAIESIDESNRGFKSRVINAKGEINRSALIFVNEVNVQEEKKLDTLLKSGDEVLILPMASGGR